MLVLFDNLLLEIAAAIYRRFSNLSLKPLEWLGFDLLKGNPHSARWARVGHKLLRAHDFPAWLILDMRSWHLRRMYLTGRYYEDRVTAWIRQSLNSGDLFLDIGANIGLHTLHAAHRVGPGGRCIAVEPQTEAYSYLSAHVVLNRCGNIELHKVGLGNRIAGRETRMFNVPVFADSQGVDESVLGSFRAPTASVLVKEYKQVEIVMDYGDRLFANIPPETSGACKIDVEGWEMEVLRGMKDFIKSHPRFSYCIEITPKWLLQTGGVSVQDIQRFFAEAGLHPHMWSGRQWQRVETLPQVGQRFQYDAVFKSGS